MSLKKTIILITILAILIGLAYMMNKSSQKANQEALLFPGFDAEKARFISIKGPTNRSTLIKDADIWKVEEEDELQADTEQVKQAIQTISEIETENIISRNPSKQQIFHVDPNSALEVEIKGDGEKTLAHLYIGKNGPDFMSTYIRKPDSKEVILHRGFHLRSRFDKPTDAWIDKSIIKFNEKDIEQIEFGRSDQPYIIKREDGKWRIIEPEECEAKEDVVNNMVFSLVGLRAIKLQRLKPDQSLNEFGLDAPSSRIKASLSDGTSQTILFSKLQEKSDQYYTMISDTDVVYTVAKNAIDKLDKTWQDLKKEEPPVPPVQSEPGEEARIKDIRPEEALTEGSQ
ncbi:DUF4340 domain-containing protein [bacterium]|nr:DUF4340 domain-containing protein [bacterium]